MQRSIPRRRWRTVRSNTNGFAVRHAGKLISTWWSLLALGDILAAADIAPWLPVHVHGLLLAGALAASVGGLLRHYQIPIRAAFLDGVMYERQNPLEVDLPMASGDDTGGAKVMTFQRQGGSHRHRPAPRPRRQA